MKAGEGGGRWKRAKKGQEVANLDEGKLVAGYAGEEVSAFELFKKPHKWDIYQDYSYSQPKAIGYKKPKRKRRR